MKLEQTVPLRAAETVAKYHIGYCFRPGRTAAIVSSRSVHFACGLELIRRHHDHAKTGNWPCLNCTRVLESLFTIADVLRSVERETVKQVGGICRTHAHYASTGESGHEVMLGIEMMIDYPEQTAAENRARIFVQRLVNALAELGSHNCDNAELAENNPEFQLVERERNKFHEACTATGDKRSRTQLCSGYSVLAPPIPKAVRRVFTVSVLR